MRTDRLRGGASAARRQRGVTLFGLMFWAIVVGFLALVGMRVLPTVNEFFTIQKAVNKVAHEGGSTVPEIRASFDRLARSSNPSMSSKNARSYRDAYSRTVFFSFVKLAVYSRPHRPLHSLSHFIPSLILSFSFFSFYFL